MVINFKKIEAKYQRKWAEKKVFEVKEDISKKKYYILDMFPYPSGAGLHIGHAFVFSLGDIFARFKRLQGYNVLYPIGYDALGLPAENAAIQKSISPEEYTKKSIKNFKKQQIAMGWSYDWSRLINTSNPEYYKWDQWIFLKMFEKGLAYRKKSAVNWCDKCKTVLANEQVVNGCCWRHEDTKVEIKQLEQWALKITDYAEELLTSLEKLEWSDKAKKLQKNWIGRSSGTEIDFEVDGKKWPIFTTRPDTIFGVTFVVISAQHPEINKVVTVGQKKEFENFLKKLKSVSEKELGEMEKEGVFTGSYAINPMTKQKIPIYAGNFVVADYGSGMVMAVPAHDKRDYYFAKKYKIPIKVVVSPNEFEINENKLEEAYVGEGTLINSGEFNGLNNKEAINKITSYLEKKKLGRKSVLFKLRDWGISRQRYWGTPIPIIYCEECGEVPVPENELPVVLPKRVKFGKGNPLETANSWVNVKCPKCGGKGKRETDTMDTFVNSSWYFLRYCDPHNSNKIFDSKKANYWAPINQYIGGPEHITMHLIYMRFYTKFLRDLGLINFDEPALKYFTQGIVHGADGEKMSKSKGNVVEPLEFIKKYGADTLRLALVSFASPENDTNWNEKIVASSYKFINRVYDYFLGNQFGKVSSAVESKLNQTIKFVTSDVENFKHNLAIIKIRQLFEYFENKEIDKKTAEKFLIMLNIYCPYVTEELWERIGNKGLICQANWPVVEENKIDKSFERAEEAIEKLRADIENIKKLTNKTNPNVFVYVMPNELKIYSQIENIKVFAVNDKNKYDPENKSSKAKPGKPGIYLE